MWYGNQLINNFWQLKVGSLEKKIVKRIITIAQISLMHSFMGEIPHQNFCLLFLFCLLLVTLLFSLGSLDTDGFIFETV